MGVEEATIEALLGKSRLARHALELNPWESFGATADPSGIG
jgi:hypothetical protein